MRTCGKQAYGSGAVARRELARIRRQGVAPDGGEGKRPVAAYPCPRCRHWHLTSKPQ